MGRCRVPGGHDQGHRREVVGATPRRRFPRADLLPELARSTAVARAEDLDGTCCRPQVEAEGESRVVLPDPFGPITTHRSPEPDRPVERSEDSPPGAGPIDTAEVDGPRSVARARQLSLGCRTPGGSGLGRRRRLLGRCRRRLGSVLAVPRSAAAPRGGGSVDGDADLQGGQGDGSAERTSDGCGSTNDGATPLGSGVGTGKQVGDGIG